MEKRSKKATESANCGYISTSTIVRRADIVKLIHNLLALSQIYNPEPQLMEEQNISSPEFSFIAVIEQFKTDKLRLITELNESTPQARKLYKFRILKLLLRLSSSFIVQISSIAGVIVELN